MNACTSSGLKTTSGVVYANTATLHSVVLFAAAATATAIVYDNASAGSGTVLAKLSAVAGTSATFQLEQGVVCNNGIYVALTGTGGEAVLHFAPSA